MGRVKANGEADGSVQLELDAGRGAMLGAEVHFFRHDPTLWPALLDSVVDLGATHVVTLLSWAEHEATPGACDFGAMRPRLDVGAFLDLAAERGLRALVRIGPRVRADLSLAGLPEHVAFDRAAMARSARGSAVPSPMPPRIFPWPSYASVAYREHVRRWIAAVAGVLAPRVSPTGNVDAIEIEDAAAVLLRAGAYARDYHPDSIAAFRKDLETRYGTTEALSTAWGVRIGRFEDVAPPTRFSADAPRDLPRHLDWARFQEHSVADFRAFLLAELAQHDLGRAIRSTVLDATSAGTPFDAGSVALELGRVGVELAGRTEEITSIRRRMTPIGVSRARAVARIIVGGSPFGRARSDDDPVACLLLAVAFGARDVELSMAIAHERWWGAPIDLDGTRTSVFDRYARLLPALRELGLERMHNRPDVVVVVPPEYLRLARVTHLFGPLGAGLLDFVGRSFAEATLEGRFGFDRSIQTEIFDHLALLEQGLEAARLPFAFADLGALRGFDFAPKLVCVPTFDFIDDETRVLVAQLAARGSRILAGPGVPALDASMNPLAADALTPFGEPARFADAAAATDAFTQLGHALGIARLPHDASSRALAFPLRDATGTRAFIAVNPESVEVTLSLASPQPLRDPVTDERFDTERPVPVPPQSARLLVVEDGERRASRPPAARARRPR